MGCISGPEAILSTVGTDEENVHDYIKKQEKEDTRIDQLQLFDDA